MQPKARRVSGYSPIQLSRSPSRFTLGLHTSVWAALLAFAGLLTANAAHAQSNGKWYYCDPVRAYYPYVSTCPAPWREVVPNSSAVRQSGSQQTGTDATASPPTQSAPVPLTPSPTAATAPSPSESQPSAAFRQGQADRQGWEAWFGSQAGDYRAGADYWAAHRSTPNRGSCSAAPPSTGADWTAGCFAAQQKLAAEDVRRKTEPE